MGDSPLDLPKNVMANAINISVRGKFATHRPSYFKRAITFEDAATQSDFTTNYFQGACFCQNDFGIDSLVAQISGKLFQIVVQGNTLNCRDVSPADNPNPTQPQAWLWQSENFVICQDGLSNPIFFDCDAGTSARSTYTPPEPFNTTIDTGGFTVPAIGATVTGVPVVLLDNLVAQTGTTPGDIITVPLVGTFQVTLKSAATGSGTVSLLNLNGIPNGITIAAGTTISWTHQGTQLPPGRMGTYGMGRNWFCLPDGKQFVASDIVGGASGTQADNYRDAVLNITENLFLVGGGNFTVPGTFGSIKAMRFPATLDVSLGQGALQVFTDRAVFSCNTPVDRLTWQSITNPILTVSLISNGATGQESTTISSGDAIFRSIDGIRSEILGRRDFDTWGNVPISFEVSPILDLDDPGLLLWGSAPVFNNRRLQTVDPVQDVQGIYHRGIVSLNFDPISSLRGKEPSVYEGLWTGMNALQLVVGIFNNIERCFAFVLNTTTGSKEIEIWEILKDGAAIADNDGTKDIPITWQFDSPSLKFGIDEKKDRKYMSLSNGEIWISDMVGTVNFSTLYWADQYPCPQPWFNWSECAGTDTTGTGQPQFRPRMGLGCPPLAPCDTSTGRPMRNGFTFQVRHIFQGHCSFMGGYYETTATPMGKFAPMGCKPICPPTQ